MTLRGKSEGFSENLRIKLVEKNTQVYGNKNVTLRYN